MNTDISNQSSSTDFQANLQGVVLAGGLSSRLGQDKTSLSLANLHGKKEPASLLSTTTELLAQVTKNVWISCRQGKPVTLEPHPIIFDQTDNIGPLGGILSSLRVIQASILVLSCDLPFISKPLLQKLIDTHQAMPNKLMTVYRQQETNFLESLVAIYSIDALPFFEEAYSKQIRRISAVIPECSINCIDYTQNEALPFFNINYPADLKVAQKLLNTNAF